MALARRQAATSAQSSAPPSNGASVAGQKRRAPSSSAVISGGPSGGTSGSTSKKPRASAVISRQPQSRVSKKSRLVAASSVSSAAAAKLPTDFFESRNLKSSEPKVSTKSKKSKETPGRSNESMLAVINRKTAAKKAKIEKMLSGKKVAKLSTKEKQKFFANKVRHSLDSKVKKKNAPPSSSIAQKDSKSTSSSKKRKASALDPSPPPSTDSAPTVASTDQPTTPGAVPMGFFDKNDEKANAVEARPDFTYVVCILWFGNGSWFLLVCMSVVDTVSQERSGFFDMNGGKRKLRPNLTSIKRIFFM